MKIVTRAEWGFDGWLDPKDPPNTVNEKNQRIEFFTHYNGPKTGYKTGVTVPRIVHRIHKGNGWKGIGYGHVVDNDGTIYEGRGFGLQGSHCPGHNVSGYSAMGYIGEGETPSVAMLASLRWLYDESQRRAGRALAKKGHRDGIATACPGDTLYRWVGNGMPATITTPQEDDDMPTVHEVWTTDLTKTGTTVGTVADRPLESPLDILTRVARNVELTVALVRAQDNAASVAAEVIKALPADATLDEDTLARAFVAALTQLATPKETQS